MAYLDSHGLQTLWTKIKTTFGRSLTNIPQATSVRIQLKDGATTPNVLSYTDIPAATDDNAGMMLPAEKTKLATVEDYANYYEHPTDSGNKHIPAGGASGNILVWSADGTATWATGPETGVSKIIAGDNISLSPIGGIGDVTITATDTVYEHPEYTEQSLGLYKFSVDEIGSIEEVVAVGKSDITALGIPAQDTTYIFETPYDATTNKAATMSDIQSAVAGTARYKGTLDSETAFTSLTNYKSGDYWVASSTFVHSMGNKTITIDSGNMIFCRISASTYAYGNFDIIQTDIEAIQDSEINALN